VLGYGDTGVAVSRLGESGVVTADLGRTVQRWQWHGRENDAEGPDLSLV
jgi:hypothetical protein